MRLKEGYADATCATEQEVERFFYSHILIGYVSNTFVNKTEFTNDPISTLNDVIFYEQLLPDKNIRKEVQLNYNEVELKDSYFLIWDEH